MSAGDLHKVWEQRRPERHLLGLSALAVLFGFLMMLGADPEGRQQGLSQQLLPAILYALALVLLHLALVLARFQGDQLLLATAAFLSGFGLLAQVRMGTLDTVAAGWSGYLFPLGIGVLLATLVAGGRGRYQRLTAQPWVWAGLSLAGLALLLLMGQRFRGGVYAPGFITPGELLKLTVVIFLAGYLEQNAKALAAWSAPFPLPPWRPLWPLAAFWTALAGLLLLQRDLGMLLILSLTLLVMLTLASGCMGYLIYGALGATGLGLVVLRLFAHGQRRLQAWQDPFSDPTGTGWQVLQGLSGMYSGGLWGEGFGQGNPEYTPIAESDFIYAVIGEELGFVGCLLVVAFLLILVHRGLRIADQSRSTQGRLLATGITTVLATQTFLNLGGVTQLIPLTGVTLPFISHGGSSLLTVSLMLGLLLAISDRAPKGGEERQRLPAGETRASPRPRRRSPPTRGTTQPTVRPRPPTKGPEA